MALLQDGGAVFVWQGGTSGFQHINARFLKGDGTYATGDVMVNTYTNNHQIDVLLTRAGAFLAPAFKSGDLNANALS